MHREFDLDLMDKEMFLKLLSEIVEQCICITVKDEVSRMKDPRAAVEALDLMAKCLGLYIDPPLHDFTVKHSRLQ